MPRFEAAADVDGVDAGAGADDQRQRAGIDHRVGDLGRSHDQHRRLRLLIAAISVSPDASGCR